MIPTAIGITKDLHPYASETRRMIQDFLARHGLQPYLPQCALLKTAHLGEHYQAGKGLQWPEAVWEEVKRFSHPMIAHLGAYWLEYSLDGPASHWRWRDANGQMLTFDSASDKQLVQFWRDIRASCIARGIEPWVMIDEPPFSVREGRTPAVFRRIQKVVATLREAEMVVGVCVPGPRQYAFWSKYIIPNRWILGAKYSRADYGDLPKTSVWLYNRNNKRSGWKMSGLYEQMGEFNADGYLQWTFDSPIGTIPIGKFGVNGPEWTAEGWVMYNDLERYSMDRQQSDPMLAVMVSIQKSLEAAIAQIAHAIALMERRTTLK